MASKWAELFAENLQKLNGVPVNADEVAILVDTVLEQAPRNGFVPESEHFALKREWAAMRGALDAIAPTCPTGFEWTTARRIYAAVTYMAELRAKGRNLVHYIGVAPDSDDSMTAEVLDAATRLDIALDWTDKNVLFTEPAFTNAK